MATLAVTGLLAAAVTAPTANAAKGLPTPKASHFGHNSTRVTNPWFPLARGSVYVYEGQKDGKQARDVMTVTRKTKVIAGIRALPVADRLFLNGGLAERTTDWYAQDKRGTVWYLGENTAELNAQRKGDEHRGLLPERPRRREGRHLHAGATRRSVKSFQQESFKGQAEDRFRILSTGDEHQHAGRLIPERDADRGDHAAGARDRGSQVLRPGHRHGQGAAGRRRSRRVRPRRRSSSPSRPARVEGLLVAVLAAAAAAAALRPRSGSVWIWV